MPHVSHLQGAGLGKMSSSPSWRGRTAMACIILAIMVLGLCASTLDWTDGFAIALGELAGMVAPLAVLSLIGWAAVALVSRSR